ncbi:hypothetical protein L226DRAFT_505666 [Lentinus tigrinus ALCF2SS1-7]|uniref:uncharacterized protein n=1 Tax=Lentinus tigrinus ALCF2SS1-7 TaxID=1328758 RepID=UPI0011660D25|nr:hypothetical protein L226DRAFT_505666 [Lentinus tigrinus ALCF2SS1-7]
MAPESINLARTLDNLTSDKATERQQGRDALRNAFERTSVVLHLDEKGKGKPWLAVFQALFASFTKELKACVSKTGILPTQTTGRGSAALKRLGDVASVVRWLTERSIERLNGRVIKCLLTHLTHAIVYQGELLMPVALDYAKTINFIVAYKPHLYALKDDMWHDLLALAFNVVVGRGPRRKFAEDLDREDDGAELDSDVEMDESDGTDRGEGPSTSKLKRPRPASHSSPHRRATVTRTSQPVTLEQIEFMSVVSILLCSPVAPLLAGPDDGTERAQQNPNRFPRILLSYFTRFLRIYTGDTSMHHDFLIALSSALSHLTLNCRQLVNWFANDNWEALVSMWGMKNQSLKGHLAVILRQLFPYLLVDALDSEAVEPNVDPAAALSALWNALEASAYSRGSVLSLSLESLQLRLLDPEVEERAAFTTQTFASGWHFDSEKALSWAVLELQADCAEKLFLRLESTYSSVTPSGKRVKLENPVSGLLLSMRSPVSQQARMHHIQVLLFLIDRHWSTFYDQLRQEIIAALVPLVSFEDPIIQSWTFLCLAAIAHAECAIVSSSTTEPAPLHVTSTWDPIWTHAMRRANVPAVSRAACHTAHTLLAHSGRLLSPHRVLQEIESFVKDLDVQGPGFPYDSVCDFMVLCLRIANQDVRLYRMQMEEKVLSWLVESWRIGNERRTSMPLHTVADIHALLEGIVSSSKRVRLQCDAILPHSVVVDALLDERQTGVIRDFQLYAHLPPYHRERHPSTGSPSTLVSPHCSGVPNPFIDSNELAPPRGRERRISAFLLKSLEEALLTLVSREVGYGSPTAERIRSSMDLVSSALLFEGSLLMNGTQSNRRVLRAACKLLAAITPMLTDGRWSPEERRLMLDAVHPLIRADDRCAEVVGWDTLVPPSERTGIKSQVLRELLSLSLRTDRSSVSLRRDLQRSVFRSADVQDAFAGLLNQLRLVLCMAVGRPLDDDSRAQGRIDDTDGFGPVRTKHSAALNSVTRDAEKDAAHNRRIIETCITALAVVPILQSSSGEATRDRALTDLILGSDPDEFLLLAPSYCEQIRHRTLNISPNNLEKLLEKLIDICDPYAYKNRVDTRLLVVRILDATSHVWMHPTNVPSPLGELARGYCQQTVGLLRARSQRCWQVQDAIIRFLDGYLAKDPEQTIWQMPVDDASPNPNLEDLPSEVLPALGNDVDIRIRFRMAATSPRLFRVGTAAGPKSMDTVYQQIRSVLSVNLEDYEAILTRLLCLGNIAISEASMRRGAYWHLLEIASFSSTYHRHLKAILQGVVDRMGLETFADLFECHASQFAYSIRQAGMDLFKFPPDLLGYRDRRECAEATFRAFTPTNLLAVGSEDEVAHGKELFTRHCQAIQISEQQGIARCFAELVSYQISFVINSSAERDPEEVMSKNMGYEKSDFREQLKRNADGIVSSILRSLGDQDVSAQGPISSAISSTDLDAAFDTFHAITQYRCSDSFQTFFPNLPAYATSIILLSLGWLRRRVKNVDSPAVTYHVLHQLFADIERTPLINEQYRLLNGLCLWIACHNEHIQEESLLRTLTLRSVSMLAQADLARGAQSLLEWCLSQYKSIPAKADYRMADVLIRISTVAHEFSQTVGNEAIVTLGADLLGWAEAQADTLCGSKSLKKQVVRALAAWPRELPAPLQAVCEEAKLSDLTSVLGDHGVSVSKFRLVRRVRDLASQHDAEEHFSTSDFWRLKACIPPPNYLVDSDINAFTSLLMLHCGRLDSIGGDRYEPDNVRTVHRGAVEPRVKPFKDYPPRVDEHLARACVVTSLRSMMDTSSASRVHVAYSTLRTLLSVSSEADPTRGCPSQIRRELQYLQTFPSPFVKKGAPDLRATLASEAMVHLARDFSAWMPRISTLLCDVLGARDQFFTPLTPVLQSDHGFAEDVLPVLVHSLLQIEFDSSSAHSVDSIRSTLSNYFSAVLSCEDTATPCYRAIINVVLHLRYFNPSREPKDALAHDRWLSVDFTLLSRCAIKCNAYTTALLFLELAPDHRSSADASNISATEQILFEIYSHIDEPDGFYGIQTEDLRNFFVKRLHHENQWDKALRYHGAVVEAGGASSSDAEGIVQALYSFGFNQLALNTMQNFSVEPSPASTESSTLAYNLGWRAETWDLPENLGNNHSGSTLYLALRAVYRERSSHAVDAVLRRAFVEEMNRLRLLGNENFTEIRHVTQNLMCLSQIRQWRSEDIQQDLTSKRLISAEWARFSALDSAFDFANIEAIMATRISLVRSVRQKEQRDQIGDLTSPFCNSLVDLEKACLLYLSEMARDVNQPQIALNSVVRAQNLERTPSSRVAQEFASVLWLMNEPKLAIKSLSSLAAAISLDKARHDAEQGMQHAVLLARLGTWSAEASMQKPSQIVSDCFGPAVELVINPTPVNTPSAGDSRASIFHQYAIFAERQYHAISKSPDALRWKLYVDRKKEEIKQRRQQMGQLNPQSKEGQTLGNELRKAQLLLRQDEDRYREQSGQRTSFLTLAVEMYARCLAASDKFDDDSPIRLCSLWLANFDNDDPKLNFVPAIELVPSHKFVFLAHQLTARLSKSDSSSSSKSQVALQRVIQRMGREHPFHSLFPLYCLRLDASLSQTSAHARRQSGRYATPAPSQLERAAAVSDVFDRIRSDPNAGERVKAVEHVCDASLEWAKYPIKPLFAKKSQPPSDITVPDNLLIRRLKDVRVPVITASTPIDPTTEYRDCVWISHYDTRYSTAGGVNLPKIIKCYGSDGHSYRQLFKGEGEDDLRQDAVMEQVFDLVNVVLRHDRETRKRKLSVRGYKVIPLAAQAGVLEFVANTTPLASWIKPAHPRYNPNDYTTDQFSKGLAGAKGEWRENPDAVIKRFIQLRQKFRPVMRHYFTEKHKTPMSWFAMRLHYSRSVATTSIVGHILGLGDRHTSNILMDNKTGEVVHIDLGIAFEQGKLLPQPERVPFRLTADMVDGLGISGTQGVFQRCAEETLRVLRDGSETILTVLEVFKYDPLHSWTASEFKIKRVQGDETAAQSTGDAFRFAIGIDMASGTTDEAADRALSTVARKLDKTLSVEYTVNELITEASDPANLALMYVGWAPHW